MAESTRGRRPHTPCPAAALQLAEAVERDGFGAHHGTLHALLAEARRRGVCDTLLAVAGDAAEPRVVRQRALGRVIVDYCAASPVSREDTAA